MLMTMILPLMMVLANDDVIMMYLLVSVLFIYLYY